MPIGNHFETESFHKSGVSGRSPQEFLLSASFHGFLPKNGYKTGNILTERIASR
jgi:hypothetical protein